MDCVHCSQVRVAFVSCSAAGDAVSVGVISRRAVRVVAGAVRVVGPGRVRQALVVGKAGKNPRIGCPPGRPPEVGAVSI